MISTRVRLTSFFTWPTTIQRTPAPCPGTPGRSTPRTGPSTKRVRVFGLHLRDVVHGSLIQRLCPRRRRCTPWTDTRDTKGTRWPPARPPPRLSRSTSTPGSLGQCNQGVVRFRCSLVFQERLQSSHPLSAAVISTATMLGIRPCTVRPYPCSVSPPAVDNPRTFRSSTRRAWDKAVVVQQLINTVKTCTGTTKLIVVGVASYCLGPTAGEWR